MSIPEEVLSGGLRRQVVVVAGANLKRAFFIGRIYCKKCRNVIVYMVCGGFNTAESKPTIFMVVFIIV